MAQSTNGYPPYAILVVSSEIVTAISQFKNSIPDPPTLFQGFSCLGKSSYVLVLVFCFLPSCSKGQPFTVQPFAMACSVTGGTLCFIRSLAPCTSHRWIWILRTDDLQGLITFPQARLKTSSLIFKSKSHKVYLNCFFQNHSFNFRNVLIFW